MPNAIVSLVLVVLRVSLVLVVLCAAAYVHFTPPPAQPSRPMPSLAICRVSSIEKLEVLARVALRSYFQRSRAVAELKQVALLTW